MTSTANDDSAAEARRRARAPWWHNPVLVTMLTAFIGIMVPAAAALQAYIQKERELELEREKHKQSIRLHYLDLLVAAPLKDVEVFLSFIAATDDSPELKLWAASQSVAVRKRIETLEVDLDAAEKRADDAEAEAAAARKSTQDKVRLMQARANASKLDKEKAEEDARKAQTALAQAERRADNKRAEVMAQKAALVRRRQAPEPAAPTSARRE